MAENRNYPQLMKHLQQKMGALAKELPGQMTGFMQLHGTALGAGALSPSTKELICLAISISVHCEGCIAFHVHGALNAGASRSEIMETIGVAVMMGGGPALTLGCLAVEALEQFEEELALFRSGVN